MGIAHKYISVYVCVYTYDSAFHEQNNISNMNGNETDHADVVLHQECEHNDYKQMINEE